MNRSNSSTSNYKPRTLYITPEEHYSYYEFRRMFNRHTFFTYDRSDRIAKTSQKKPFTTAVRLLQILRPDQQAASESYRQLQNISLINTSHSPTVIIRSTSLRRLYKSHVFSDVLVCSTDMHGDLKYNERHRP